jgi:hypothetical protein
MAQYQTAQKLGESSKTPNEMDQLQLRQKHVANKPHRERTSTPTRALLSPPPGPASGGRSLHTPAASFLADTARAFVSRAADAASSGSAAPPFLPSPPPATSHFSSGVAGPLRRRNRRGVRRDGAAEPVERLLELICGYGGSAARRAAAASGGGCDRQTGRGDAPWCGSEGAEQRASQLAERCWGCACVGVGKWGRRRKRGKLAKQGADTWRGVDVKDGFGPGRGQGGVFPV